MLLGMFHGIQTCFEIDESAVYTALYLITAEIIPRMKTTGKWKNNIIYYESASADKIYQWVQTHISFYFGNQLHVIKDIQRQIWK